MHANSNKPKIKELSSKQLKARGRRYYFDLKESEDGTRFITISETQPANPNFNRMRLMVFTEYLDDFLKTLEEIKEENSKNIPEQTNVS